MQFFNERVMKNMGLITKEVEVRLHSSNVKHYEQLGYVIPRRLDVNDVLRYQEGATIIVLVKDLPRGSGVKLEAQCDLCQKDYFLTYNNYLKTNHYGKIYCRNCAKKLFYSGEKHPWYKHDKTDEERELRRCYPEYTQFIKRVLARDKYTCQCCQRTMEHLEVHHLDGYDWCKDKRTDDTNGIALCKSCHSNFHSIYGNGGNTKGQFEEWFYDKQCELHKFDGEISSARKIYCYEEDKIYNSALEFVKTHHLHSTSTVYFVCNQTHFCKTIQGMHLFWNDEYIKMSQQEIIRRVTEPSQKNSKKVICLTTNTIYLSIAEGARQEQASKTSITRCCDNKSQHARTKDQRITKWMYYDEYLKVNNKEEILW